MSDHLDSAEHQPSVVADETSDGNSVHLINDDSCGRNTPQTPIHGSSEALAKGISTMLSGVIRDFDCKAEDASKSQDQLSCAVDRLTGELDQLLEDAPLPFIMQHAAKLSNVRKRVSSLNSILRSIQHRLDKIDRMLSMGLPSGSLPDVHKMYCHQ